MDRSAARQKRTARLRLNKTEHKIWGAMGKERLTKAQGSQETCSESSLSDYENPMPEGRNPSQCDDRTPQIKNNFIDRCKVNVTVSQRSGNASKRVPKIAVRKPERRNEKQRKVRFHRYDEHIYDDCTEYVYSLYDREVEAEAKDYDIVDEVEEFVGDVAYFFRCLKDDLQEKAVEKMR